MKRSLELNRETLAKLDDAQANYVQGGLDSDPGCGVTKIGPCVSRYAPCGKPKLQA